MNETSLHRENKQRSPARDKTLDIVRLYHGGVGHKTIAKHLGVSPRIVRVILIEWGIYRPGSLINGLRHKLEIGRTNERIQAKKREDRAAAIPEWEREQQRREFDEGISKEREARSIRKKTAGPIDRKAAAERFARRYTNELPFRITHVLRSRVRKVIKRGYRYSEHTLDWLGCTPIELIAWLESQWTVGMTWGNYGCKRGQWSIDHKRPCNSFDLLRREEREACFHYTNLQPMWHVDSVLKSDTYSHE